MNQKKNALLWEITRNGEDFSYLFGTMHVFEASLYKWEESLHQRILECDSFYTEVNFNDEQISSIQENMELPEGQSLKNLLKKKQYQFLEKVFYQSTGLYIEHLDDMQPMIITNLLQSSFVTKNMPFSIDHALWKFAESNGIQVDGLERYEDQMAIMQSFDLDYQTKQLRDLLKNFKRSRKNMKKMVEMYLHQDINGLYKKSLKGLKQYKRTLVYERNHLMIKSIDDLSRTSNNFFAVGAAHLSGKSGLINGLKKLGWKVKSVNL
ncbi:MAG: TraB/GumN family protein [Saprospiraceae bacterium]|nr:TraB/GumN family protein [Saprospiraceae bacterium]